MKCIQAINIGEEVCLGIVSLIMYMHQGSWLMGSFSLVTFSIGY